MKVNMYVMYDKLAETYGQPVFLKNDGLALRMLSDTVNGKEGPLTQHPEDFQLFRAGEYNQDTGEIVPLLPPQMIAEAKDYLETEE